MLQDFLMLWFFIAIAFSHLAHFYLHGVTNSLEKFSSTLILYVLIVGLVTTTKRLKIILSAIVILTIVLGAQGIIQRFVGVGIGGQTMISGRIRALGIFSDPNDLGLALLMVMPTIYFMYFGVRKRVEKFIALVAFALLTYSLYLTVSRGCILSLGLVMILLIARTHGKVFGIVGGVLIVVGIMVVGPGRLADISVEGDSAHGRVYAWSTGMELFKANPIFGIGWKRFTEYHAQTAHNSFILCASELGLFGLFPWIMMILVSMRNNFFISNQHVSETGGVLRFYANSLFYGLVGFTGAAFFLSRTYVELLYIFIALSVASAGIFLSESNERYRLWEKSDFVFTLFTIIGFLILFQVFLVWAWM
jgi:O-antigen ligase